MRLQGKVALVTGASRGIGHAIARRLADEGASVAVHYNRQRERAAELVATIEGSGGRALAVQGNLRTKGEAGRLINECIGAFGQLDILVNVAGVAFFEDMFSITEDHWDQQFDVNAKSVFFLCQAAAYHMRNRHSGRIVNVTSISGEVADPDLVAYCASKGAATMLTRALAAALGPYGITVNAVLPGTVPTDMNSARLQHQPLREMLETRTPLGRLGDPDDIAGAVIYFCLADSQWTTGACLVVDGGFTA